MEKFNWKTDIKEHKIWNLFGPKRFQIIYIKEGNYY